MERTTALWVLVVFFGASLVFAGLRRATEDAPTSVTVLVQLAALALIVGVVAAFVRRGGGR